MSYGQTGVGPSVSYHQNPTQGNTLQNHKVGSQQLLGERATHGPENDQYDPPDHDAPDLARPQPTAVREHFNSNKQDACTHFAYLQQGHAENIP